MEEEIRKILRSTLQSAYDEGTTEDGGILYVEECIEKLKLLIVIKNQCNATEGSSCAEKLNSLVSIRCLCNSCGTGCIVRSAWQDNDMLITQCRRYKK